MNIEELKGYLDSLARSLQNEAKALLDARLSGLTSVFPFNEYEYVLMFLLDKKIITFGEYERLRSQYVSANRYLDLYGLAPRVFGEIWGHEHVTDLDKRFQKASKSLDANYDGQYDLWIDGVKVEVKAARAINTKKRGSLVSKALRVGSREPFWMNFQQIKPDLCDVFIFVAVWADQIMYWVLSNRDAKDSRYLSHQHRGGIEYQIGITHNNIADFDRYKVGPTDIAEKVIKKGGRQ